MGFDSWTARAIFNLCLCKLKFTQSVKSKPSSRQQKKIINVLPKLIIVRLQQLLAVCSKATSSKSYKSFTTTHHIGAPVGILWTTSFRIHVCPNLVLLQLKQRSVFNLFLLPPLTTPGFCWTFLVVAGPHRQYSCTLWFVKHQQFQSLVSVVTLID